VEVRVDVVLICLSGHVGAHRLPCLLKPRVIAAVAEVLDRTQLIAVHKRCCVRRYLVDCTTVGIHQHNATTKGPAARCNRGDESAGTVL